MSSNFDPVASATKGVVKAGIEWTEEKILQSINAFKNKKLAFIEDPEIIEKVKKQRQKGEWELFKTYTPYNEEVYILYQTGLTLREYEGNRKQFDPLIRKIYNRYKTKGVHIAWFAQNGLFSKYVGNILETGATTNQTREEIKELFENIDNKVIFVSQKDGLKPKQKAGDVIARIISFTPEIFIISSIGGAISACEKIKNMVMEKISSSYFCELYESEEKSKLIYFLIKLEDFIDI